MRPVFIAFAIFFSSSVLAQPKGSLENPADGSYSSGVYIFSGWVCEADEVEIYLESLGITIKAAYGTEREDTQGACGDSDNGFGLLVNMSLLGTGEHTAIAYADGQEFSRSTFSVQRLSTGEFGRELTGFAFGTNFPSFGKEVWLQWVESTQNFMIVREQDTPDLYDIEGGWYSDTYDAGAVITTDRLYSNRKEVLIMLAYTGGWELYSGYIIGTRARVQTVSPYGPNVDATVDFSSSSRGVITVNSCVSANGFICAVNAGTKVSIRRVAGVPFASIPQNEIFSVAEEGD